MILAGDVGGTKVHLALFRGSAAGPTKVREELLGTAGVTSLPETLAAFVGAPREPIRACALGVAGPVVDGDIDGATNLPWSVVRRREVAAALGDVPVHLLNDLEASGHGLGVLGPDDLETLREGRPVPHGNRALVSPGTGLGESILLRHGDGYLPVGSEGGHADFSPRTDEEMDLLRHLRGIWGCVSVERVVSGPGLVNVFCWLRDSGRVPDDSGIRTEPEPGGAAPEITAAALQGRSRICTEALRVWVSALGSEAGNLALRGFAVGGVYLGGGIPLRVLPALRAGGFLEAFADKSSFREALGRIPVHVVRTPETTLRGAALVALGLAG